MDPFAVIPGFDVLKQGNACCLKISVPSEVNFLFLQSGVERLDAGIVIRAAFAAKGWCNARIFYGLFKSCTCILAAKVGVEDQFRFFRLLNSDGIFQGGPVPDQ